MTNLCRGSEKILTEQDVLARISVDAHRGPSLLMIWERVLEHVRNGEIIVFNYATEEIHWYQGLGQA